jgi:hypothetical protein
MPAPEWARDSHWSNVCIKEGRIRQSLTCHKHAAERRQGWSESKTLQMFCRNVTFFPFVCLLMYLANPYYEIPRYFAVRHFSVLGQPTI